MLGVRRCGGVQIDLFQGDPATFVCDHKAKGKGIEPALEAADLNGYRHVVVTDAGDPRNAMAAVKRYLTRDQRPKRAIGRITFVLPSLDVYCSYQDALFETFPDET